MTSHAPCAACAIVTTPQLMRDLKELEHLIAALRRGLATDPDDLEDLSWLQSRRRYVLALLAARRAQKGRKVVRLDLWRDGGISIPGGARRVA